MFLDPPQSRDQPLQPITIMMTTGYLPSFRSLMALIDVAHHDPTWHNIMALRQHQVQLTGLPELPLSMCMVDYLALCNRQELLGDLWSMSCRFDPTRETGYDATEHYEQLLHIAANLPVIFDPPRILNVAYSVGGFDDN